MRLILHTKKVLRSTGRLTRDSNVPHPNTTRITLKNTSLLLINLISIFNLIIMIENLPTSPHPNQSFSLAMRTASVRFPASSLVRMAVM